MVYRTVKYLQPLLFSKMRMPFRGLIALSVIICIFCLHSTVAGGGGGGGGGANSRPTWDMPPQPDSVLDTYIRKKHEWKAPPALSTTGSYATLRQSLIAKYKRRIVERHNRYREYMGVDTRIRWDAVLENEARSRVLGLARSCLLDPSVIHSGCDKRYGENIVQHSAPPYSAKGLADLAQLWEEEASSSYDPYWTAKNKSHTAAVDAATSITSKVFNPKIGHATQMAWRTTTSVGCAAVRAGCNGGRVIMLCTYYPPGNVVGNTFRD